MANSAILDNTYPQIHNLSETVAIMVEQKPQDLKESKLQSVSAKTQTTKDWLLLLADCRLSRTSSLIIPQL
jgi:hypothetical protein